MKAVMATNTFQSNLTDRYNAAFAKAPRRLDNQHCPMNIELDRLRVVFCFRDERLVGAQLSFSHGRKRSSGWNSKLARWANAKPEAATQHAAE